MLGPWISPVNTAVWYFQLGPVGEIRVIDWIWIST